METIPTILLVDDDPNNTSLFEDIFELDDIPAQLITATNGEEVMSLATSLQPVLILMDLRLPGLDGMETTKYLKNNPLTKDIPVWAITAYSIVGYEEQARAAGCDEYFAKPLSMRGISGRLRVFLRELERQNKAERQEEVCLSAE